MTDEGQTFEALVALAREAGDGDAYWDIIWILAHRGDQKTLEQTLDLTRGDAFGRSFSASVLGRLGVPQRFSSPEVIGRLLEMITVETDNDVISALVSALGHQENEDRIPVALKRFLHHPDADIRWHLAVGLGGYETMRAIEMLIELSRDPEEKVRDWATFGLGTQCDLDTPEIRAALVERLDDEDEDTRAEAIFGLAKRKDRRAVDAVLKEFDAGSSGALLFQAISETPDYRLLPALREMAASPEFPENDLDIQAAIAACESHCDQNES